MKMPGAPTRGAVVSDHPLASAAGLEILASGGNAADAAVAMAAVLSVVRPHMCGVGGDAFALFFESATGSVHALNGSGRAGALATPDAYAEGVARHRGSTGPTHITVPGAVAAWGDANRRFGTRPLKTLLAPAIGYARDGFQVSDCMARELAGYLALDPVEPPGHYFVEGAAPPVGSTIRNRALAHTLEAIADEGSSTFYGGPIADSLADFLRQRGSHVTREDLTAHESTWVKPLHARHFGHTFYALPPNSQGIALLQQLGIARALGIDALAPVTAEYLHILIEAKKLAFADRDRWVGDPSSTDIPVAELLEPSYLEARAGLVRPDRAADVYQPGVGRSLPSRRDCASSGGDTVYLTAVDGEGNAVSWIQSLYSEFGSGLMDPATGVLLHNRGARFSLDQGHPNCVAPGKRPFHTLSPSLALRDGRLAFSMGTPGADGQTQTLTQVAIGHIVAGLGPQAAVDAPRFRSYEGLDVAVEGRIPSSTLDALEAKGHRLRRLGAWEGAMGSAQMIRDDRGTERLGVGADPRREARAGLL